jgi:type VI secretion system protein VasD
MKTISAIATATAIVATALCGCGSGATIAGAVLQLAGVNRPPEVPDAQKPPRNVTIRLHASATLNSGNGGPPLALVARIYKLRQADAFERISYDGHVDANGARALLGPDLLEMKEVLLIPGQRYEVTEKVSREAGFIGVVALFRSPDGQRWRATFPAAQAETGGITLGVYACALGTQQGAPARQPAVAQAPAQARCA